MADKKLGTEEMTALASYVTDAFERAKEARQPQERIWLEAYYNTLGEFSPDIQATWNQAEATQPEGMGIFYRLTGEKVRSALAQMDDVAQSIIDTFDLEADESGEMEKKIGKVAKMLSAAKQALGMEAADIPNEGEKIEKAIEDLKKIYREWLAHDGIDRKYRGMILDAIWSGTGFLRVSVPSSKDSIKYQKEGIWNSRKVAVKDSQEFPGSIVVSPWDVYPAPDSLDVESSDAIVIRHRMSPQKFWRDGKRLGWSQAAMDRIAERKGGGTAESWEQALRNGKNDNASVTENVYVLEYWGECKVQDIREQFPSVGLSVVGKKLKDNDWVCVTVCVCDGEVLKASLNPFYPVPRKPFLRYVWDVKPSSFWGMGLPESIFDPQRLINGTLRLYNRGKAFSCVPMFTLYADRAVEGQDLVTLYPGKPWVAKTGAEGPVIDAVLIPDNTSGLMEMLNTYKSIADEVTGVNMQTSGLDAPPNANTATGQSIVQSNSNRITKARLTRLDDVIEDHLGFVHRWFQEFDQREELKVPVSVRATGVRSSMVREFRSARLMQLLNVAGTVLNKIPADPAALEATQAGKIDFDELIRQLADAMEVETLVKSDDDDGGTEGVAAKLLLQEMGLMPEAGIGSDQGQVDQMQAGGLSEVAGNGAMPPGMDQPGTTPAQSGSGGEAPEMMAQYRA